MSSGPPRILLTGAPGAGKTTLLLRVVAALRDHGVAVNGFATRELREGGERVGFAVEDFRGQTAVLARVTRREGPRVGRYRVDVAAFERVALPALEQAGRVGGLVAIDELGLMELCSGAFVVAVEQLFAGDLPLLATVHARSHPVTDRLKSRPGVELFTVTRDRQRELSAGIVARLLRSLAREPS